MTVRTTSHKFRQNSQNIKRTWPYVLFLLIIMGFCLLIALSRMGHWLVHQDTYSHMKWAVVLSGQSRECERTDRALELFKLKKIDTLLISSMRVFKTRFESEFLTPYLIDEGYDSSKIFELRHDAHSTLEEATGLIEQLRLLGIDSVLIITSNFHTARSKKIFNHLSEGKPHFLVDAADNHYFKPDAWWSTRMSAKHLVYESIKSIYTKLELKKAPKPQILTSKNQLKIQPQTQNILARFTQHFSNLDSSGLLDSTASQAPETIN